jgi:hypothetical protein
MDAKGTVLILNSLLQMKPKTSGSDDREARGELLDIHRNWHKIAVLSLEQAIQDSWLSNDFNIGGI